MGALDDALAKQTSEQDRLASQARWKQEFDVFMLAPQVSSDAVCPHRDILLDLIGRLPATAYEPGYICPGPDGRKYWLPDANHTVWSVYKPKDPRQRDVKRMNKDGMKARKQKGLAGKAIRLSLNDGTYDGYTYVDVLAIVLHTGEPMFLESPVFGSSSQFAEACAKLLA